MTMEMSTQLFYTDMKEVKVVRSNLKLKTNIGDLNGIYKEIASISDIETAKKMYDEYRGQQITFPMEYFSKSYIYSQIKKEYDGSNIKQLAAKFEYSERTIRRIISHERNEK